MNWPEVWGVLKWVVAALIAGFVGQFGKSLALFLMKRRRSRRASQSNPISKSNVPKASSSDGGVGLAALEAQAKIEKKRAKAKVKRLKKS